MVEICPALASLLQRKSFNLFGFIIVASFSGFAAIVTVLPPFWNFVDPFHCYHGTTSKTKEQSLINEINIQCFSKYKDIFLFGVPVYAMLLLNFLIFFSFNIIYGVLAKSRVEKFDCPPNENDDTSALLNHNQNWRDVRECLGHFSTFAMYIFHLFVARIVPLLTFAVMVFFPVRIPNNFSCFLPPNDPISLQYNLTVIRCINPNGKHSKFLIDIVGVVNVGVVILTFLELGYIMWLFCNDTNFITEKEFCTVYLLRKRKRIRKHLNKIRRLLNIDEVERRSFEDINVNVVIQNRIDSEHAFSETEDASSEELDRHINYKSHFLTTVTDFERLTDVFQPINGDRFPRTILFVGRALIGKTIFTNRVFYQWHGKKDKFWNEKIIILLELAKVDLNDTYTQREMLSLGKGLTGNNLSMVYDFILSNASNTIIVFDGLDRLITHSDLAVPRNIQPVCDLDKKRMSVFSHLKLLMEDKSLHGVTIIATSRPLPEPKAQELSKTLHFDREFEILGFQKKQIEKYVEFEAKNKEIKELVWNQLEGSIELLSLCYIPVMSQVVCSTLKENIVSDRSNGSIPKTITELFKEALQVLLDRHYESILEDERNKGNLENKLKELAKCEFSDKKKYIERTIDGEQTIDDVTKCGLFHVLPAHDGKNVFRFLHLTLQEFLAASKVVDDIGHVDALLETWIEDSHWHLVIQFVAGLVGEKIREARKKKEGDTGDLEKIIGDIHKRYYA